MVGGHSKKGRETMGFVPKDGDQVIVNPEAMKLPPDFHPYFITWNGRIFVVRVHDHFQYPGNLMVELSSLHSVAIDRNSGAYWYAAEHMENAPSLFFPASTTASLFDKDDLKRRNTEPGRTECVQCGTPLHNVGWYSMQYCPKCEP